jgi:glycoside/pentoside/hexuronide:cation symporter, GPH family
MTSLMKLAENRWDGLPVRVKVSYALGGMTDSVKAVASGLYMLFFYSTVLGLPAKLVGLAAAISLTWDASIDPVIGRLSDRTKGRFGRRHGWMLVGALGTGAGFVILFSPPQGLSNGALFTWLLVTWLALRASHSMFTVPYMALGAELCSEYDERTTMAGYRAIAAQIGAVAASALTLLIFFSPKSGSDSRLSAASYADMAIALGLLIGAAGVAATIGTWSQRGHVPSLSPDAPSAASVAVHGGLKWKVLLRSRAFVLLTASASLYFTGGVIASSLMVYFMTYYAGVGSKAMAYSQFALYAGLIAGVPLWARIARRYEKHHLQAAASLLTGLLVISGFWIVRAGGIFAPVLVPVLVVGYGLIGMASCAVIVLPASMLADVIDEHDLTSSERREGAFFGAFSASQQVSAGVATVIAGLLVDYFAHVVPGAPLQTPATIVRIGILACGVPGGLMLLAGLVVLPYRLSRRRTREIQTALAGRAPLLPLAQ